MPRDRFVRPDTVTLPLSEGDWILVKRRLNAGETRDLYARMYRVVEVDDDANNPRAEGSVRMQLDTRQVGLAIMVAYLVDWSFVQNGERVPVRMLPIEEVETTLRALDPESFGEIRRAIEAHEEREDAARDALKKTPSGEPPSWPISASRDSGDGDTNGFATSTPMSASSSLKT
jgi:hypothetical protein